MRQKGIDGLDQIAIVFAAAHGVPYRDIGRIYKRTRSAICGIVYRSRSAPPKVRASVKGRHVFTHQYSTWVDAEMHERIEALRMNMSTSELLRDILAAGLDALEEEIEG